MNKLDIALKAANETKAILIGAGVVEQTAAFFKKSFPGKRAVIIADSSTYPIAGELIFDNLNVNGVKQDEPFIFNAEGLFAEYGFAQQLVDLLKQTDAIPIAVGTGSLNDMTKFAAFTTGRRYMCFGTAASMDGYTAYGASITYNGVKQTFQCPAPLAWIGDTEIICAAPQKLTAAGYADLIAKLTSGADWIISDELGIEPINKDVWDIVQGCLPKALGNPKGIHDGDKEAIENLVEGLILSGFAMQVYKTSRPASGAEHQFNTLWEMQHFNNHRISHGFQVAIGTLSITAMYEQALKEDMSAVDIDACCKAWPTAEELKVKALDMFEGTDFPEIGAKETAVKYVTKSQLADRLALLKERWPIIAERLKKELLTFDELKERLQTVGAPTKPEDIGMTREYLRCTYIRAQYIRRRFTVLDLGLITGNLDKWLNAIFGKGGRWEM